jgi:hypothetical protein
MPCTRSPRLLPLNYCRPSFENRDSHWSSAMHWPSNLRSLSRLPGTDQPVVDMPCRSLPQEQWRTTQRAVRASFDDPLARRSDALPNERLWHHPGSISASELPAVSGRMGTSTARIPRAHAL